MFLIYHSNFYNLDTTKGTEVNEEFSSHRDHSYSNKNILPNVFKNKNFLIKQGIRRNNSFKQKSKIMFTFAGSFSNIYILKFSSKLA